MRRFFRPRLYNSDAIPQSKMQLLLQTPDILLRVIELSDIDTFLSFRLTNRAIHNLISLYESCITQSVARVTFPTQGLLLRPPSDGKFTIRWLIDLIPKQLATIAVDRWNLDNCPNLYGVFAENPEGDPIRERVDCGWRILQKLSLIARDVDATGEADLPLSKYEGKSSLFSFAGHKRQLEITARREHLVTQKRLEYCRTLESSDLQDYVLMELYLQPCIRNIYIYLRKLSYRRWSWAHPLKIEQKKAESILGWMKWFILKEGSALFWEQWWRRIEKIPQHDEMLPQRDKHHSGKSALDRMLQAYHSRSKDQIEIEVEAVSCITSYFPTELDYGYQYLEQMRLQRDAAYQAGQTLEYVAHTLWWVPFEFERCPVTHQGLDLNGILHPNRRTSFWPRTATVTISSSCSL